MRLQRAHAHATLSSTYSGVDDKDMFFYLSIAYPVLDHIVLLKYHNNVCTDSHTLNPSYP